MHNHCKLQMNLSCDFLKYKGVCLITLLAFNLISKSVILKLLKGLGFSKPQIYTEARSIVPMQHDIVVPWARMGGWAQLHPPTLCISGTG